MSIWNTQTETTHALHFSGSFALSILKSPSSAWWRISTSLCRSVSEQASYFPRIFTPASLIAGILSPPLLSSSLTTSWSCNDRELDLYITSSTSPPDLQEHLKAPVTFNDVLQRQSSHPPWRVFALDLQIYPHKHLHNENKQDRRDGKTQRKPYQPCNAKGSHWSTWNRQRENRCSTSHWHYSRDNSTLTLILVFAGSRHCIDTQKE